MHNPVIRVRLLIPKDAKLFRNMRLEALQRNPEAFGSTYGAEHAKPLNWFKERLGVGNTEILGAFRGEGLIGIAGFAVQQGPKTSHKGRLWSMYVRPASRNAGVGAQLVQSIFELACGRVELIQLSVVKDNAGAGRFYSRLGFEEYGIEKKALKHKGRYYDEILMSKDLPKGVRPKAKSSSLSAGRPFHRSTAHKKAR